MDKEQKQRFDKLEESIHKVYRLMRLMLAIGVGVLAGCLVFALGASIKISAWTAIASMLFVEIETIYEAKRRAKKNKLIEKSRN